MLCGKPRRAARNPAHELTTKETALKHRPPTVNCLLVSLCSITLILTVAGSACVAAGTPVDPPAAPSETLRGGPLGAYGPAYADTPGAISISKRLGMAMPDGVAAVTLEPISNDALIAQDGPWNPANNPEQLHKALRYGVGRDIAPAAAAGQWLDGPEGTSLWVLDIRSPGAVGIRVHLRDVAMPPGAEVVAFAPETPGAAEGPFTDLGVLGTGVVWTPTTFGDTCRLEMSLPKGVARVVPFTIDSIQHIYRNLWEVMDPTAEIGTCHNDVTCFPAWANTAKACAGIGSISGGVSLYCSGTMLNTTSADQTPYWLTANHCLSTEAAANTAEIYWFYQTPTCNGTPPALGSVPRSTVATLVSANAATDHSLILIRGALPAGVYWAGWSSTRAAASAPLTAVHHPDGSWKRYSTGTYAGTGTYSGASAVRSNWNSGVTEPGSSGSGLFISSTQQLVGELFGGPSACGLAQASLYDWYGDFTVTYANYPTVSTALAGGTDDSSEPNNSCAGARALAGTSGTLAGRIVKFTSEDWYSISVPAAGSMTISLASITNAYGNVNLQLFTTCAGSPVAASSGTGSTETATYTNNTGAPVTLLARVYLATSVRNTYDLAWSSTGGGPTGPANDLCANAITVPAAGGTFSGSTVTATSDGTASCGGATAGNDLWYSFTAPAAGTLTLNTCGSAFDTVVSLFAACGGTQLSCGDDSAAGIGPCPSTTQSYLQQILTGGQSIRIRLGGYNGATGTFTLSASWVASGPTVPANDNCSGAITVSAGSPAATGTNAAATTSTGENPTCAAASKGIWYNFTAARAGSYTFNTEGSAQIDTVLTLYSGCGGTQLACDDDSGTGNLSALTTTLTAGQNIKVMIASYGATATGGGFVLNILAPALVACSLADIVDGGGVPPGDGTVDGSDFIAFINAFSAADPLADLVDGGGVPPGDGTVDGSDFVAFVNAFSAGC